MKKINQAVILAAGNGTRLRPYTEIIPKVLFPVKGKPIINWVLTHLAKFNFQNVIICLNASNSSVVMDYVGNGKKFGLDVSFSVSRKALGTLGEVRNCKKKLDESFLLYYGDQIAKINLREMENIHHKTKSDATLALTYTRSEYGLVHLNHDNKIITFQEKPKLEFPIWTGISFLEKSLLVINKGKDFARNLFPIALRKDKKLTGYITDSFWYDIGSISQFDFINKQKIS